MKAAAFILIAAALVAAMATGVVLIKKNNRVVPAGSVDADGLDNVRISYSRETEDKFVADYKIYLIKLFQVDSSKDFSLALFAPLTLLKAMENAGITADKALSFSRYLANLDMEVSPIAYILLDMFEKDENGFKQDENGQLILKENANVINSFFNNIDAPKEIDAIISNTGITAGEIGALFFEYQMLVGSAERKALLVRLTRKNFVALFFDTVGVYLELRNYVGRESGKASYQDGRMAREMLYELGSRYKEILDSFGGDNLEKLLGLGTDIFPTGEKTAEMEVINEAARALKGMTPYAVNLASLVLTSLPAEAFYAAVDYINGDSERGLDYFYLEVARRINACRAAAAIESGIPESDLIGKMAKINASIRASAEPENGYEYFLPEERQALEDMLDNLEALSADYREVDFAAFKSMPEADYNNFVSRFQTLYEGAGRLEAGLSIAENLVVYGTIILPTVNYLLGYLGVSN
jgi:hypothetical protein